MREVRILLVDDEPSVRGLLRAALSRPRPDDPISYVLLEAEDGLKAQAMIAQGGIDIVITDLLMPRMGGLNLLQWAQNERPGLTWIILSGVGTLDDAIRAISLGAFAFVTKTPQMVDSLTITVRNAVHARWLEAERARFETELAARNAQLARHVEQLTQQAESIERDLARAELIQRALLPATLPPSGHFAVDVIYRPSQNVGGDLYDVIPIDGRQLGLYVADATGHGVAAAMLAVLFKTKMRLTREGVAMPPAEVLRDANQRLFEELFNARQAPGMFLTAAYATLNLDTNEVTVASAGHPPLLLQRGLAPAQLIARTGPALGLIPQAQYSETKFVLGPGERLLLYTDGLSQGSNERAAMISQAAQVLSDSHLSGRQAVKRLVAQAGVDDPRHRLADDVTLLLLANSSQPSSFDNGIPRDSVSAPVPIPARPVAQRLLFGSSDGQVVIAVVGPGQWHQARTFHEACMRALRSKQSLLIDLSACPCLDSTMFGTLQEIATFSTTGRAPLRLQGLCSEVQQGLEEMGMLSVLELVLAERQALPAEMVPMRALDPEGQADRWRLIDAHQALAALNEQNRTEFAELIEGLRQESRSGQRPNHTGAE